MIIESFHDQVQDKEYSGEHQTLKPVLKNTCEQEELLLPKFVCKFSYFWLSNFTYSGPTQVPNCHILGRYLRWPVLLYFQGFCFAEWGCLLHQ